MKKALIFLQNDVVIVFSIVLFITFSILYGYFIDFFGLYTTACSIGSTIFAFLSFLFRLNILRKFFNNKDFILTSIFLSIAIISFPLIVFFYSLNSFNPQNVLGNLCGVLIFGLLSFISVAILGYYLFTLYKNKTLFLKILFFVITFGLVIYYLCCFVDKINYMFTYSKNEFNNLYFLWEMILA